MSKRKGLMVKGKVIILLVSLWAFSLQLTTVFAQEGFNAASTYDIDEKDVVSGDIIVSAPGKGIVRSVLPYDSRIFGVLQDNPVIVLREVNSAKRPVIRLGDAIVNVLDSNDPVKKGDLVTTSSVLGKGMKAKQSGYVLGVATEDAAYTDQTVSSEVGTAKLGTVRVAIKIEYAELNTARNSIRLLEQLNGALFKNVQNPEQFTVVMRYIIAGLIALIGFGLGFFTIGRSITKGIEAIGRNPMARNMILTSLVVQVAGLLIGALIVLAIIYVIVRI